LLDDRHNQISSIASRIPDYRPFPDRPEVQAGVGKRRHDGRAVTHLVAADPMTLFPCSRPKLVEERFFAYGNTDQGPCCDYKESPQPWISFIYTPSYFTLVKQHPQVMSTRILPECWGHRGASAALPENTLASFEAAIRDGAEGIETDVHVSRDNILIMFHDRNLERTTDAEGFINEKNWYGIDGMEHVRTVKEPKQAIPTFVQTLALLMKEENQHVQLNVDCKANNDPVRLFSTMHQCISAFPQWEKLLAPRILLGLWHPTFIAPALEQVPYLRRAHIGRSPHLATEYFWSHVEAFSIEFGALASMEGQKFIAKCAEAGKKVLVWTVNKQEEMMEAVRWNVHAILTDVTWVWLELRSKLNADYEQASQQLPRSFLWTSFRYYTAMQLWYWRQERLKLESLRGPFSRVPPLVVAPLENF